MLPISTFIFPQFSGQLWALQSIVSIQDNKNKVLATCRQVPDLQVQVPSLSVLMQILSSQLSLFQVSTALNIKGHFFNYTGKSVRLQPKFGHVLSICHV